MTKRCTPYHKLVENLKIELLKEVRSGIIEYGALVI
jgi:hypothetical protein